MDRPDMSVDYICTHESYRLSSKDQRRLAKAALSKGEEPEPEYRTGKIWYD